MLSYYLQKYGPAVAIIAISFFFGALVRGCNENTSQSRQSVDDWQSKFDSIQDVNREIIMDNIKITNRIQERNELIRGLESELNNVRNEKDSIKVYFSGVLDSINNFDVSDLQEFFSNRYPQDSVE